MAASASDAHPFPIYNARYRVLFPMLDADGDLVAGASTPDAEISQDCGTFADATNESTEIATSSGMYYLDLIATELDTKSTAIIAKSATAGMKTTPMVLYPVRLPVIRTGTAQAGAASTITLDSGASAIDDYYVGCYVNITNDSPANARGQARRITAYNGSTKVATVEGTYGTNPSSASTFELLATAEWTWRLASLNAVEGVALGAHGAGYAPADVRQYGGSAGTFSGGRPEVNTSHAAGTAWNSGAIGSATLASDTLTSAKIADGAITAAKIADAALTAAKFAAGAFDAVWSVATRILTAGTNIVLAKGTGVTGFNDLSEAQVQTQAEEALQTYHLDHLIQKNGTADSGTTTTMVDSARTEVDDYWNGSIVLFTSGSLAGQARLVEDFDAANDRFSFSAFNPLTTAPGATHDYVILPADLYLLVSILTQTNTMGTTTLPDIQSRLQVIDDLIDTEITTITNLLNTEVADILADTNELQTDWANGGRLDLLLDLAAATLTAAGIRTAVGLASANLDTQLDALPTGAENAAALLDLANAIETGLTLRQAIRLQAAAAAGKLSGAATSTVTIRNAVQDSKDRIVATVDADGNRSAVTTDVT